MSQIPDVDCVLRDLANNLGCAFVKGNEQKLQGEFA
jgi:hypothetical protein